MAVMEEAVMARTNFLKVSLKTRPAPGAVIIDLRGSDLTVELLGTDDSTRCYTSLKDLHSQGTFTVNKNTQVKGKRSRYAQGLMFALPIVRR